MKKKKFKRTQKMEEEEKCVGPTKERKGMNEKLMKHGRFLFGVRKETSVSLFSFHK